jgi:hypothetical protein
MASTITAMGPWPSGQRGEPVAAEEREQRADDARDSDARGEELEDQQRQPDQEHQVRDRRTGDRVHQLIRQVELGEAHERRLLLDAALVVDAFDDRVEDAPVGGDAVHREDHAADRRHADIGCAESQRAESARLLEAQRIVAQLVLRGTERHAFDQTAGVADAASAHHRRDVGDAHQLRRQPVETRLPRRADPDADRDRCCRHTRDQTLDLVARSDRAARGDLQDQRL